MEAGAVPASDLSSLFREHAVMIAAIPEDVPAPVDDDDEVWIEALVAAGPVGIPHAVMADLLGITIDAWLAPDERPDDDDDDDDAIDWEH